MDVTLSPGRTRWLRLCVRGGREKSAAGFEAEMLGSSFLEPGLVAGARGFGLPLAGSGWALAAYRVDASPARNAWGVALRKGPDA
jgi:hypothetical protein